MTIKFLNLCTAGAVIPHEATYFVGTYKAGIVDKNSIMIRVTTILNIKSHLLVNSPTRLHQFPFKQLKNRWSCLSMLQHYVAVSIAFVLSYKKGKAKTHNDSSYGDGHHKLNKGHSS